MLSVCNDAFLPPMLGGKLAKNIPTVSDRVRPFCSLRLNTVQSHQDRVYADVESQNNFVSSSTRVLALPFMILYLIYIPFP